jgi:hypothetical protein
MADLEARYANFVMKKVMEEAEHKGPGATMSASDSEVEVKPLITENEILLNQLHMGALSIADMIEELANGEDKNGGYTQK